MSTQCLCVVLVVFLLPRNFHTKMTLASFNCNCTDFRISFVPLTQTRTFQPIQQQNTVLVEFTAFKHAATAHQLHKTHGITFTGSLKALFPFPSLIPIILAAVLGCFLSKFKLFFPSESLHLEWKIYRKSIWTARIMDFCTRRHCIHSGNVNISVFSHIREWCQALEQLYYCI